MGTTLTPTQALAAIRAMASNCAPHCVNLDSIDRIMARVAPVGVDAPTAPVAEVLPDDEPIPGVFWACISCQPSRPHRYEAPHTGPRPPYARFETEAAAWRFIKGCGISPDANTRHWEAAYHASTPPTCDTRFCYICRESAAVVEKEVPRA